MPPYTGSYIGSPRSRQSPAARAAAVVFIALSLAGCGSLGLPFGAGHGDFAGPSTETTGAIPVKADAARQVDSSDWEAIRRAIAGAPETGEARRIEWSNPDTGSTGVIATLDQPTERGAGAICQPFATTVNDVRGVYGYRGEACRHSDGRWQLHGVVADDARLS